MAEESGDAKPPIICLPLSITISVHHTLLLLLQSPEPEIAIAACKALLAFARDEEDGPTQIRSSPWSPGFQVEPIQILQRLLSHEEAELQGLAVTVLAVCAAEEPFRLRTVELDALAPMIKQVPGSDCMLPAAWLLPPQCGADVADAYCHALYSSVMRTLSCRRAQRTRWPCTRRTTLSASKCSRQERAT